LSTFPLEVVFHLFSFLDGISLGRCALICCMWRDLIEHSPSLWENVVRTVWTITEIGHPFPKMYEWKKLFVSLHLQSKQWTPVPEPPFDWADTMVEFWKKLRQGKTPDADGYYVHIANWATPIWYRYDKHTRFWSWTPDKENWMNSGTKVVLGGRWHGQSPVPDNISLINWLHQHNPSPRYVVQKVVAVLKEDQDKMPQSQQTIPPGG